MFVCSECLDCLLSGQHKMLDNHPDQERKDAYFQALHQLTDHRSKEDCAPYLAYKIKLLREEYFGKEESMLATKLSYDRLVLNMESSIAEKISASDDPLRTAMHYARIGNYIDFSAVENVTTEAFLALLEKDQDDLDSVEYQHFCYDLKHANSLLYIMDNCGEIVLDKLVIRELQKQYPDLQIIVMVRDAEAVNDATIEDADIAGLSDMVPIITNNLPVQGIVFSKLQEKERRIFEQADVIISKGQGNYESVSGCGKNVYYSFLCKCDLFTERFQVNKFDGLFINELRFTYI